MKEILFIVTPNMFCSVNKKDIFMNVQQSWLYFLFQMFPINTFILSAVNIYVQGARCMSLSKQKTLTSHS